MFFVLSWAKGHLGKKILSPHEGTHIMPLTSLILAVCRMHVIWIHNRSCSPWHLHGSVVECWSTESEGLRFDSSWGLRIFFFVPRLWQDEEHLSLRQCFFPKDTYTVCILVYLMLKFVCSPSIIHNLLILEQWKKHWCTSMNLCSQLEK